MSTRMGLADFQRNNLWVTFAVAGALLAFLFLPDMLGFEGGFHFEEARENFSLHIPKPGSSKGTDFKESIPTQKDLENQKDEKAETQEPVRSMEKVPNSHRMRPLELLAGQVNNGYIGKVAAKKRASGYAEASGRPRSWQEMKSVKNRQLLGTARTRALMVANKLDQEKAGSRYALMNFSNGVDLVLSSNVEQRMSLNEALDYLDNLDGDVNRALHREKVPKADSQGWSEVSIKPVLGNRQSAPLEKKVEPKFSPEVRLVYVNIRQKKDKRNPKYLSSKKPYSVKFGAFIKGAGVKTAWILLKNGKRRKLNIRPVGDEKGKQKRFFRVDSKFIKGAYRNHTLLIRNKKGKEYKQVYRFSRAFTDLKWKRSGRQGNYYVPIIPFLPGAKDEKLEHYFRSSRYGNQGGGYFQNFEDRSNTKFRAF